jgi:hypothetical protein
LNIDRPRRLCFLYIAQIHQVLHSLSVAVELARRSPELSVEVVAATPGHLTYARNLVARLGGAPIRFRLLAGAAAAKLLTLPGKRGPGKLPLLLAGLPKLMAYDAIVLPERTSLVLKSLGLRRQLFIHTDHGAGDRAKGFESRIGDFDLTLLPGRKHYDRLVQDGLLHEGGYAVVGYPKFDLVDRLQANDPPKPLFERRRTTVLYNPHFTPELSSWRRFGPEVLQSFAESGRHNLIFAPHIRLAEREKARLCEALAPYYGLPNLYIDLGSPASVNMTYTTLADVYLGDVSSQVYEFLRQPRPCLFLDAHKTEWRDNPDYAHWRYGRVLDTARRLPERIDEAVETHARDYAAVQAEGFAYTFDLDGRSSSERAAEAVADYLGGVWAKGAADEVGPYQPAAAAAP